MQRISFVDSRDAAERYAQVARPGGGASPEIVVAMNPSVACILRAKGHAVSDTLPYFTTESHKRVSDESVRLLGWVREHFELADAEKGIREAYVDAMAFWMRIAILYCLRTIETVQNAADRHAPEELAACLSGRAAASGLYVEPCEKTFGELVRRVAAARRIRSVDLGPDAGFGRMSGASLQRLARAWSLAPRYLKFCAWEWLTKRQLRSAGQAPLLFTTRNYQMGACADSLKDVIGKRPVLFLEGPFVAASYIPDPLLGFVGGEKAGAISARRMILRRFAEKVEGETDAFSYRGISFADILCRKLEENIAHFVIWQTVWAGRLERTLDSVRPRAVFSTGNRVDDVLIAEICKKRGIVSVLISHGSHVRPKDRYEATEWGELGKALMRAPFSVLALQSPVEEGFLREYPSASRIMRTGPLTWGRSVDRSKEESLRRQMFGDAYVSGRSRIIVHAGTPKRSRVYTYETFDEYLQALQDLADVVERTPDLFFIVRFRPLPEISVEALKQRVRFSRKVRLSIEEPFNDILAMADLLASFSSTTIETALMNAIPVLLYGGSGRYQRLPAPVVRRGEPVRPSALYHVGDVADLEYAVRGILALAGDVRKEEGLFAPFNYPKAVRVPLASIVQN